MRSTRVLAAAFMLTMLAALACGRAFAQGVAFTSDAARLADAGALRSDGKELDVYKGGDAVWGVLQSAPKFKDITPYTSEAGGATVVRVIVSLRNEHQNFDPLFTAEIPVTPEQARQGTLAFAVIPDTFSLDAPGLHKLLDRMPDYGKKRILFKVRIEGSDKRGGNYLQSGFWLDLAGGLGRHAEWIQQKNGITSGQAAVREQPLIAARTAFVRKYTDARDDPRLAQDIFKWWSSTVPAASPMLKVVACSSDYDIVRNTYGIVTSKQACALLVHKRASGGKCFVQWRKFGYESLGGGAFDTQLKNWTPSDLAFTIAGEKLDAGKPYEVDCSVGEK